MFEVPDEHYTKHEDNDGGQDPANDRPDICAGSGNDSYNVT